MSTGQMQERNAQLVRLLSADLQLRYEPNFAWKSAVSAYLALPGLRAFWPMSSVDYAAANRARDLSGQGYHLTDNNTPTFGYTNLAPWCEFNGTTQYLSRVDGGAANWADIRGTETYIDSTARGLTLGGWFKQDAQTGSVDQGLISKYNTLINQRAYLLETRDSGAITFVRGFVSVDGTAATSVGAVGTTPVAFGEWFFAFLRFVPSTSLDLYYASESVPFVKVSTVVAIPASIFDSTADFMIGAFNAGVLFYDGKASMCTLCAAQLSDAIIQSLFEQTKALFGVA